MSSLSDLQLLINGNIKRHHNSQCIGAKKLQNNLVVKNYSNNLSNTRTLSPLRHSVYSVSGFESNEQSTRPSSVQFIDQISTNNSVLTNSFEGDSVTSGSLFDQSISSSSNSRATSARQRRKLKLAREKSQRQVLIDHEQRINLLLGEYFTVVNQQQITIDRTNLPGEYLDFGFHESSARQVLVDKLIRDIQDAVQVSSITATSPSKQQALSPQQKLKLLRNRVSLDAWKGVVNSQKRELQDSIILFIEMRYMETKEKERNSLNVPTKNKAAVAADLLLKLCGSLGGHSVVLQELVFELLNCVFEDYAAAPRSFSLEQSVEDFSAMRLFVEGYADKCEQIEDLQQEIEWMKQGVKMKAIVKKFQCVRLVFDPSARFLRDTCFNMWKSMYTRTVSYKSFQIRKQLKHRVHLWKEYVRDKYVRIRNELRTNRSASMDSVDTDGGVSPTDSEDPQQAEDANSGQGVNVPAFLGEVFANAQKVNDQSEHNTNETQQLESPNIVNTADPVSTNKMALSVDIGLVEGLAEETLDEESPSRTQQPRMTETMRAINAAISKHDAASGNKERLIIVAPDSPHEGDEDGDGVNSTFSSPMAFSARMPRANYPNGKSFSRRKSSAASGGGDEYLTRRLSILQKERSSQLDQVNSELMATLNIYTTRQSMLRSTRSSFADGGETLSPGEELWAVTAATSEVPSPPDGSTSSTTVTSPHMRSRKTSMASFGGGRDGKFLRESVVARGEHGAGRASKTKKELVTGETQTPASWMGNVALLDLDRSPIENSNITNNSNEDDDVAAILSDERGENSPSKTNLLHREDSHNLLLATAGGGGGEKKYLMDVRAAEELIAFVYGSLLPDVIGEPNKVQLSDVNSLISYSKELLLRRYAIKRLASKLSKGLVKCCLTHAPSNRRIGLFAQLCGITIESVEEGADAHRTVSPAASVRFDRRRFTQFLSLLGLLFHNDAKELRMAMNGDTQDIWRETAISALSAMFPTIYRTDYELFAFIRFEINSLPVTSVEHNEEYTLPLMKVNVDELLLLLLDYMDLESNTASHAIMPFERIGSSGNGPLDVKQVHLF